MFLYFQVVNAGKSRQLSRLGSAFSSVAAQKLVYKVYLFVFVCICVVFFFLFVLAQKLVYKVGALV